MGNYETIALTQKCNTIIQESIHPKMQDPRSFTIPCPIRGVYIGQAPCDLGASINLMQLSMLKRLGIEELAPTKVTLQLADRSLVHPEGKLENVLVKVDKFVLPSDVIILDYEADKDVPIILERPFLSIGRTQIDAYKGETTMQVSGQKMKFNILKAIKYSDEVNTCQAAKLEKY
ncbi:uncharacterized protein LOC120090685 [Benincasa hispida]|uniref:uncharacterized protein LOC120090685 n=1 Tax=Benincasa hispida TaxID=102211 RepID=UPI0018FF7291|nr:uncharacterized protein LOC120090685 [Benincasa hispida]